MQELLNLLTSSTRWVLAIGCGLAVVAFAARMKRPRWPVLLVAALVGVGAYALSSQFV